MKLLLPVLLLLVASCKNNDTADINKPLSDEAQTEKEQQLKTLFEKYPDSLIYADKLYDLYFSKKQYLEAASVADKAYKRNTQTNIYYLNGKADAYRMADMYDSAIANFKAFLTLYPDDENIARQLCQTYAEAGKPDALILCAKLEATSPTPESQAYYAYIRGIYYHKIKKITDARSWYDKAIQKDYTLFVAYYSKGESYYDEQKFAEAQKVYEKISEINNSDADAYYWTAKCQEALKNIDDAIANYEKAIVLNKNFTEAKEAITRLKK